MPLNPDIKKVLVIGSGPIVIGQAAEFDYAGTQACRVLKQAGLEVVLVNSNPATIMTDGSQADEVYLEPLTERTIERIIEKERPDSLLATLGGQTGLTIAMQLSRSGFLKKTGVRLLGTGAEAIERAEDRRLFREAMEKISKPVVASAVATETGAALEIAERIGYPVVVRPAFTLGGAGGGFAYSPEELAGIAGNGISLSPIGQVLIEKSVSGWKEIEFEVIRDGAGNAVAVCSMENIDPVGIHTGDSVVAAPALTLAAPEYRMLRAAALDIIAELGIEGGCNVQFALDPESFEYAVIEVNPRVSRSSALASKATGYPIAKVAAKIAVGYRLDEIENEAAAGTSACFEPAVDYVVVKLPKWSFDKFEGASRSLGTQMKATGEVMAIAPTFEAALMKAVRGAELGTDTLNRRGAGVSANGEAGLEIADDLRLFRIFSALKAGTDAGTIAKITGIDRFFISRLELLAEYEKNLAKGELTRETYLRGKRLGYTDAAIERISGQKIENPVPPVYKRVDTCAGEFEGKTPYFYSVYAPSQNGAGECEAAGEGRSGRPRIIVLGSGPIRIGQGIEFDYSAVHCVRALKEEGYEVVIINNNPETVSTDFDTADRLYFEPLTVEDVMAVVRLEKPLGVVAAFGGQTSVKLAKPLEENGVKILGTDAETIDLTEDRDRFDGLLETLGISRPRGLSALAAAEAEAAAEKIGYPVLMRPSYVIGGESMRIVRSGGEVLEYMERALAAGPIENPILIDSYLEGIELEVDVLCDGENILIPGIMEHIERAGVHSGDSIAVYPQYNITDRLAAEIVDCSGKIALALGMRGILNIQFLIHRNELYVIEANPRASRTVPYISKVSGVPMIRLAAKLMLGAGLTELGFGTGLYKSPPYAAVKVPVFSFEKFGEVNTALGPLMKSTGEVLGIGKTIEEALFKGLVAAGTKMPPLPSPGQDRGVLISVSDGDKYEAPGLARSFADLGYKIYTTEGTARAISAIAPAEVVEKLHEGGRIAGLLKEGRIDYIVATARHAAPGSFARLAREALRCGVACMTSPDTAGALVRILKSRFNQSNTELVDLNDMRRERQPVSFVKMQGTGNDYIYFDNFSGTISCPESFALTLCDRHYGIGGDGLVLIEGSEIADAKMRIFNNDGSEGKMAGNSIRCVAKYLYDNGIVPAQEMRIETASGVKSLVIYPYHGRAGSVRVDMGKAELAPEKVPALLPGERIVGQRAVIGGKEYEITCVSVGNPHCVVFSPFVDGVDIERIGPEFENSPLFPERVNTEFVRVVNPGMLKMRVWERGNGETWACGTGACAAVVAAVENGYCGRDTDITVKLRGGDLVVRYTSEGEVFLTGDAVLVYEGSFEY